MGPRFGRHRQGCERAVRRRRALHVRIERRAAEGAVGGGHRCGDGRRRQLHELDPRDADQRDRLGLTVDVREAPYWDPFDVDIDTEPYEIWRRLRDVQPVYRNERYDFFALSRFDAVEAAHRDPSTYLSSHGTVLELMGEHPMDTGMMIFLD